MTIAKSLLCSAAGLFVMSYAQAADLPTKAKPVEYVKICSLHGLGFYYIPGTDTCLKVGGFMRVQTETKAGTTGIGFGSSATMLPQGAFTRTATNDINFTIRAIITLDARTQTEYGTLRSYLRTGWNQATPGVSGAGTTPCNATVANNCLPYMDRAFIQFAGFTVGLAQSFFDMFTIAGSHSYLNTRTTGDTVIAGQDVWAYTVQFGGGVSYTLSLEDPASHNQYGTLDNTAAGFMNFAVSTLSDNGLRLQSGSTNGFRVPDIITNLRLDQAWGYVGLSTAIHDVSGAYYQTPNSVNNGHPADKYGWAFSISGQLNLPDGDVAGINYVYAKGAPGFAFSSGNWQIYNNSNRVGVAWIADGIFSTGTDIELTEAWSLNAAYQHFWGPAGTWGGKWRTSIYGGYVSVNYTDRATALINQGFAAGSVCGGGLGTFTGWTPLAGNSCSPDFSFYQMGSRTQFNPHALMDIGLDVFYTKLNSAYKGPVNYVANGARPACTNNAIISCTAEDQGVWSALMRWQRNFYP